MLDSQAEQFVSGPHFARLATAGRDGYPHVTVMWYLYENGCFYMTTTVRRVKYHNVRRNPKVGFVIEHDPYTGLSFKADVVDFIFDDLDHWNRRIAARYTAPEELDEQVAALMKDPRVILKIEPKAVMK